MIIKKRGVEYWVDWPGPGSNPNPAWNEPKFPEVTVVDRATTAGVIRDYLLLAVEENQLGIPSRLVATPTDGTRWRRPWRSGFAHVEAWDVRGIPAYAPGLSSDALPPPGRPSSYLIDGFVGPVDVILGTAVAGAFAISDARRVARRILRRDPQERGRAPDPGDEHQA